MTTILPFNSYIRENELSDKHRQFILNKLVSSFCISDPYDIEEVEAAVFNPSFKGGSSSFIVLPFAKKQVELIQLENEDGQVDASSVFVVLEGTKVLGSISSLNYLIKAKEKEALSHPALELTFSSFYMEKVNETLSTATQLSVTVRLADPILTISRKPANPALGRKLVRQGEGLGDGELGDVLVGVYQ